MTHKQKALSRGDACRKRSMHEESQRRRSEQIAQENLALLKRIQDKQRKPSKELDASLHAKSWREKQRYCKLASHFSNP
ncbi:hypothetical protein CBR_g46721 [Chara braunii]|uniref:Uncharacterized protein n=1 Tax=Chara braunii TaxID=69332 RepID=A0A388K3X9_CHABU|nr:hypothetical protein CBR_g46721 [Chara braunii]|eukprot:GBG64764.1 hypothetical protein CBR_g46721 [Chara braunii]